MAKMHFFVGNDNGNSEHDIIVDGKLIQQPNVNIKVDKLPWSSESDISLDNFIEDIFSNLVVSVNSPSCRTGMYYVGKYALATKNNVVDYMQVGTGNKAYEEIPLVNTLANIAAYGVYKSYTKNHTLPEKLSITCDMATALPVMQWTDESAKHFKTQFMKGIHNITVHIGIMSVNVDIRFDFVKVLNEGSPVIFALKNLPKEAFAEFNEMYGLDVDGSYFEDKRILHNDIGDGTTEHPVTEGQVFLKEFSDGSENGAGHAIENGLEVFRKNANLPPIPRQYLEDVLKKSDPRKEKLYPKAISAVSTHLENQASAIYKKNVDLVNGLRNELDINAVYGGGSILMREYLFNKLKALSDEREFKLLYIPAEYSITLNAIGLDYFVRSDIFKTLKEVELAG